MLAVDLGLKRIGLAQYMQGIIVPLVSIHRKNRNQAASDLEKILKEKDIKTLIMGISNEIMEKRANHFLKLVNFSGKIKFISEDISTKEAEELIRENPKRKKMRKDGSIDSIAAMIILQRYIALNPI